MRSRNIVMKIAANSLALTMLAVLAPNALATPGSTNQFCNHHLDSGVVECFDSRATQIARGSSVDATWVLSAFNWIDHNPGGGVWDYYREAQCTTTVGDVDYPASASDFTGRNLQQEYYNNEIVMNNTISSVLTPTGGCDIKLWDYNNYGSAGGSSEWIQSCTHLGVPSRPGCPSGNWYDRAGSFKLS